MFVYKQQVQTGRTRSLPALPDKLCFPTTSFLLHLLYASHCARNIYFLLMVRLQIELPHVRQKTEWDCGLACTLMVLQKLLGNKFDNAEYEEICAGKNFGTSVWTIDIASIFTDYKADYVFCTKTLGVDPSYGQNSFYERTFNFDETRVNRLFTLAPTLGLKVEKR